jgi:hypothetical protein
VQVGDSTVQQDGALQAVEGADGVGEAGGVLVGYVVAGGRLPVAGEAREMARVLGGRPGRVQGSSVESITIAGTVIGGWASIRGSSCS